MYLKYKLPKMQKQTKEVQALARRRDKNRDKAKELFLESNGLAGNGEIAEKLGIDSAKIRKWKCIDKWKEALEKIPKKGVRRKVIKMQPGTAHLLEIKMQKHMVHTAAYTLKTFLRRTGHL